MPLSLSQRVVEVTQAAERLRWRYALAAWAAGGLMVLATVGGVDALWRGHDLGTRLVLSLLAIAGLSALAWRFFRPLAHNQLAPLDVAHQIDRHFPQFGNRLASAVSFLGETEHDPLAGSAELRRQVVAQAESLATGLDFRSVLDDAAARRALRWLLVVAVAAGALVICLPRSTGTALARLAAPWARIEWPRKHYLTWVDAPSRLAKGQDLELTLEDRQGKLPDSVELHLFFPTTGQSERRQMRPLNARMVYRLENVTHPFRFRASGGDDDSLPWQSVQVVEPPQLTELTVEVTPPAYTGWPAQRGGRLVRLLAGSQVRVLGEVDQALGGVRMAPDNTQSEARKGQVATNGLAFEIPAADASLVIRESSKWHLEVQDGEGLVSLGTEGIEFRAVPDHPPQVAWKTPADNTYLTPQARVRLTGIASDDLGIAKIELKILRGEGSGEGATSITLFDNAERRNLTPSLDRTTDGVRHSIEARWNLRDTGAVQPGDVLSVSLLASDFSPQTTIAPARRLLVISVEEFQQRVQQRQGALLGQLADVLKLAREARNQSRGLEMQWESAPAPALADLTRLQNAELNQRQVEQQLADPATGIKTQVGQLLDELADNLLEGQALGKQLQDLQGGVQKLAREQLPRAAQSLGTALKEVRSRLDAKSAPPRDGKSTDLLAAIKATGQAQDETIEALDAILSRLNQWDSLTRLAREVTRIRQEEQTLREQTEQLRLRLAAADAAEAAQRAAESRQLAQQQFDLTRQLDRTFSRMEELRKKLAESQPEGESSGAALLADALDAARNTAVSGLLQAAGQSLAALQPQPALQSQDKALAALASILEALSGRPEKELKRRLEELEATSGQLDSLLSRQQQQRQEADQAAAQKSPAQRQRQLERLSRAEERLAQEVKELKRKLERLRARPAADAAEAAADQMAAAAAVASRGEAEPAQNATREAQRLLEETKKQLQAAVRQAQADLVQEEMARLEQLLAGLAARQQAALEESQRLEKLRVEGGGAWQRAQLASLKAAALEQHGLADETKRLGEGLQSPAFALSLRGAAREMQLAGDGLDRTEAGPVTQQAQQAALNRLQQLTKVLDENDGPQPMQEQENPGGEENEQPPNVQSVNELKLLLLLQQEINRRTTELDGLQSKRGEWTPEMEQQLMELTAEQGRVADIVQNLLTRTQEPDEESLPKRPANKDDEE